MIKAWVGAACVAAAAFVTGALAQSNGFAPEMEASFFGECTGAGGGAESCGCAWGEVQSRMTGDEYAGLDAAIRTQQMHPAMAQLALATGECNGTSRATADNPAAYPGFVRDNFINGCSEGGAPQGLCVCVMDVMERDMTLQDFSEFDHGSTWGQGEAAPHYDRVVEFVRGCAK